MRKKAGSIQYRGTSWRISYYDINHVRQYETHPDEETAHRELAKRLSEIANGIPVSSKPNSVKFGELCKDVVKDYQVRKLSSVDDIEARFRLHIEPVFGRYKAISITTAQIKDFILKRHASGAKTGSINRELEAIKRAFRLAYDEGKLLTRGPKIPMLPDDDSVRKGFFTREEVERLCSHLKAPLDSFVMFAFLTGWRLEEIRDLKWSHVDFAAGEIRLDPGTTKNGEPRVFPITNELRQILVKVDRAARVARKAAEVASGGTVLHMLTKEAKPVFEISGRPVGAFRKTWKTANSKAGLPCIYSKDGKLIRAVRIFHDLRRSAAREMENHGVPRSVIMELMGHKTEQMFLRYRIVSDADKRRAADILNGARNGATKAADTARDQ